MDGAKFAKLCRDSKLLSRTVTASDADLFFAKVCPSALESSESPLHFILRAFLLVLGSIRRVHWVLRMCKHCLTTLTLPE